MNVDVRSLHRYVQACPEAVSMVANSKGDGKNGASYQVVVASLPKDAQIRYWREQGHENVYHLNADIDHGALLGQPDQKQDGAAMEMIAARARGERIMQHRAEIAKK